MLRSRSLAVHVQAMDGQDRPVSGSPRRGNPPLIAGFDRLTVAAFLALDARSTLRP
jgi:hypothetical protein